MATNALAIATNGYAGSINGYLSDLSLSTDGYYGIITQFPFGLLVHNIQLYEINTQNPIVGAIVELFDSTNHIRLRSGISDVYGRVSFGGLLYGQYSVRVAKLGVYNFPVELISVINDHTTSIIYGSPIVLSGPGIIGLCRIHVFLVDFGLIPSKGIKIYVRVVSLPQKIDGFLLDWLAKTFETDENGYAYFDAIRGAKIFVQIKEAGIEREFLVPDTDTILLKDLTFPPRSSLP